MWTCSPPSITRPTGLHAPLRARSNGSRSRDSPSGGGCVSGHWIGPAHLTAVPVSITERRILRHDREAELAHLETAADAAERQLERLHRQLDAEPGSTGDQLIDLHRLILRSPELAGESQRLINLRSALRQSGP